MPRTVAVQQFTGLDRAALPGLPASLDNADALEAELAVLPVRSRREPPVVAVRLESEAGIAVQRGKPGTSRQEFPPLKSGHPSLWINSYFLNPWAIVSRIGWMR